EHVKRAAEFYEARFGKRPFGMWPGEGSVAQEIIDIVASQGFGWVSTDVDNLVQSLGGRELSASEKFSIYRGTQAGKSLGLVFRDKGLSDDIGFRFGRMDAVEAANDFVRNLWNIQRSLADSDRDHIVVVVLDGENAWQGYERDGKFFFRALYRQLAQATWLKTTTVSEFLKTHPLESLPPLEKLWAGSWDGHSFATWIGEAEENVAWNYLARARREFEEWKKGGTGEKGGPDVRGSAAPAGMPISEEALAGRKKIETAVYELLLIAEGSDWFWWYGRDKDSGNDERFDEAFRNTLKQAYEKMGRPVPAYLSEPIIGAGVRPVKALPGGKEELLLSVDDELEDDNGPGTYTYPTNPVFNDGAYDIRHIEIAEDSATVIFRVSIAAELTVPWGGDIGFCLQGVDIYIDADGKEGSGAKTLYTARNAAAEAGSEWEYFVMANMDEVGLYDSAMKRVATARVGAWGDPVTRTITVRVPKSVVGKPDKNWKAIVFIVGHDGYSQGRVRPISPTAQEWVFGGSQNSALEPRIMDLVVPAGQSQKDILGAFKNTGRLVEIPGVKVVAN
ncbi:MAG: glucodextranase DOMON-like domain-containing protein, partial [Candidatus Eisenbacteria bacterium]